MIKRKTYVVGLTALLAISICGCKSGSQGVLSHKADALVVLNPTQGNNVQGTIYFTKVREGVRVQGEITGLKPGLHGFHIHEKGDCSSPDAMSAGPHYDPTHQMPHGAPTAMQRHMGDFGNIEANAAGVAKISMVDRTITLDGPDTIAGHAVIVHADPDDLKSQPAGKAGARVACGVIGRK
jgi:Cu-Zn family superoxide dismutase